MPFYRLQGKKKKAKKGDKKNPPQVSEQSPVQVPVPMAFKASFGMLPVPQVELMNKLEDLEEKILRLQKDLEQESELWKRILRERVDLSVQLIALADRLEDAEGTTASQSESINKRVKELVKLRDLLEGSQLDSQDAMDELRKKHQDACLDYKNTVELLQKRRLTFSRHFK